MIYTMAKETAMSETEKAKITSLRKIKG